MGRGLPPDQNVNRVITQKLPLQGAFLWPRQTNPGSFKCNARGQGGSA
jgi:hypothetical protein